jgi:hypothetical protein
MTWPGAVPGGVIQSAPAYSETARGCILEALFRSHARPRSSRAGAASVPVATRADDPGPHPA